MKVFRVLAIILCASVASGTVSCSAKNNHDKTRTKVTTTDTIMQQAVGDSVYHIIKSAKKIEIQELKLQSDTTIVPTPKKVPSKEHSILNFIVTNPRNYISNKIAYGQFAPQFEAKYTLKKATLTLKYDFGLRKWGIFDASGKQLAIFDLDSDNMLRYACQNFPNNKFFNELLLTR